MGRGVFIIGAAVIALTLTGCVDQPTEAVPTATVPEYEVGDTLTEEEAAALLESDDSLGLYQLSDGTYVLTEQGQPLPQSVIDDATALATAIPRVAEGDTGQNQPTLNAADALARDIERATGHNVLVIVQTYTGIEGANGDSIFANRYLATGPSVPTDGSFHYSNYGGGADKAVTVAYVQQWIAMQPDAGNWTLIVQGD